jgi:alpha 1,2-mannosyltransferase
MRQLEARFNHKFNYPYVFLNDEPFTQEFKELTRAMTSAEVQYGERHVIDWMEMVSAKTKEVSICPLYFLQL